MHVGKLLQLFSIELPHLQAPTSGEMGLTVQEVNGILASCHALRFFYGAQEDDITLSWKAVSPIFKNGTPGIVLLQTLCFLRVVITSAWPTDTNLMHQAWLAFYWLQELC